MNMKKNNDRMTDILFTYFRGEAGDMEKKIIREWYEESEENKKAYWDCHDFYEAYLMQAPKELLEGNPSVSEGYVRRRTLFRNIGIAIANVAAVIAIFFGAVHIIDGRYEDRLANTMTTIEVPAGKSMDYTLPDGTTVKLNSGARFSYPMMFAKDSRKVSLDGEAFFNVAHNAEQPFIVSTFASDITVLGTEFNVNAEEESNTFLTALVEGSVKISGRDGKANIIMKPNEVVTLVNGHLKKVASRPISDIICWTDGRFDACGMSFDELMRKMETAYGVNIEIELTEYPELKYTSGKFYINDGIDHALRVLQHIVDFRFERDHKTNTIYIRPLD